MNKFHYYYIIQDIWSLLLIFIGLRYTTFILKNRKLVKNISIKVVSSFIIIVVGLLLLLTKFNLIYLISSVLALIIIIKILNSR